MIYMAVDPFKEQTSQNSFYRSLLVQEGRIAPEYEWHFSFKVAHTGQMAFKAPPENQQGIGLPGYDLFYQIRIVDPFIMVSTRIRGDVFDELIVIPIQQRNIPLDVLAKTWIEFIILTGLFPGIKDLEPHLVTFSQKLEQGCVILNGMARYDRKFSQRVCYTLPGNYISRPRTVYFLDAFSRLRTHSTSLR